MKEEDEVKKFECEEFAQYIMERKRDGMPVFKKRVREILGMPEGPYYDGDYVIIEYPAECALHYIAQCRLNGETVDVNRLRVWAL